MALDMLGCVGTASILAMATATPVNFHCQSEYPDFYFRVTNSDHMTKLKQHFKRICEKSGVRKRHMYLTEEILKNNLKISSSNHKLGLPLSTQMEMAAREAPLLGMEAAEKAIQDWGRPVSDITHLVFATTSAVAIPTADCRLANLLGLRPSVRRHFLFGHACAGAGAALRLAKTLAEAEHSSSAARVLVVCSENMAVNFSAPSPSFDKLVGHAAFGDGAAAVVVGKSAVASERPLFRLVSASQTLVPDSEAAMLGSLGDSGVASSMSLKIPLYVRTNIERIVEETLAPVAGIVGKDRNSLFYAMHPGVGSILDQISKKLGLGSDKLRASRHVLAEYGNMWSPTVLFVLEEVRRKSVAEGKSTTGDGFDWGFMASFGPGFTAESMVLQSVPI